MKVVLLLSILYQFVFIQSQSPVCNQKEECAGDAFESDGDGDFSLTCMGDADIDQVCKEASVTCIAGTQGCTVICSAKDGCTQANVDARDAVTLMLLCGNFDSSCKDMTVACPEGGEAGDACIAMCPTSQVCEGIVVFDPADIFECTPAENCGGIEVTGAVADVDPVSDPEPDPEPETTMTMFETTPDPSAVADPSDVAATTAVITCTAEEVVGGNFCKDDDTLICEPANADQCDANFDGKSAGEQASISSNGAAVFNANCDGETACKELEVTCTAGTECNAFCEGKSGCEQAIFRATLADSFDLDCGADESSCKSAVVFCPTSGDCTIDCPNDSSGTSTCEDLVLSPASCTCTCTGLGCGELADPETVDPVEADPEAEPEADPEADPEEVVITPETPETEIIAGTGAGTVDCTVAGDPCSDLSNGLAAACPAGLRTCTFNCGADEVCKDSTLVGNGADEVIFTCGGDAGCTEDCAEDSCQDSILDCGADARFGCTANCIGKATCSGNAEIDGSGILAGDLVINCGVAGSVLLTEDACKGLIVRPPTASGTTCTVNCPEADAPCQDIIFNDCACNGPGCPAADECDTEELAENPDETPNCPGSGVVAGTPSPITQEEPADAEPETTMTMFETTPDPSAVADPSDVDPVTVDPVTVDCTDAVTNPEQCTDIEDVPVLCTPADAPSCTFDCGADAICKDSTLSGNGADAVTFDCTAGEVGGVDACQEATFDCSTATECSVICDGKATCSDGVIDASGLSSGATLTITCGVADATPDITVDGETITAADRTEDACKELTIGALPAGVNCIINCPSTSDKSCLDLEGAGFSSCTCNGPSCPGATASVAALALGNDERVIGIEHGEENINDNNNIDDDYFSSNGDKKITLSLSENTTIHIWAMMAVFLLCNISLYVCYHNKFKVRSDEITRMEKNYSE